MTGPRIILASSSPYRRLLLERLGMPFTVVTPDIDERPQAHETPPATVERLAVSKARTVCRDCRNALIIGADQIAVHDGNIVGKPRDHAQAVQQLRAASGSAVTLYTGVALINSETTHVQSAVVPFRVVFRQLTDRQIEDYLRREQPYDCTGAVKVEGLGIALLERMEGDDPSALIGLPLIRLVQMLEKEGIVVV
jgi:septum formation protein